MREIQVDFFVDFISRNNFVNSGSSAKVSVSVSLQLLAQHQWIFDITEPETFAKEFKKANFQAYHHWLYV